MSEAMGKMPLKLIDEDSIMDNAYVCRCPHSKVRGDGVVLCMTKGVDCYGQECPIKEKLKVPEPVQEYLFSCWSTWVPYKNTVLKTLSNDALYELVIANYLKPNIHPAVKALTLDIINKTMKETPHAILEAFKNTRKKLKYHKEDPNYEELFNFVSYPKFTYDILDEEFNDFKKWTEEEIEEYANTGKYVKELTQEVIGTKEAEEGLSQTIINQEDKVTYTVSITFADKKTALKCAKELKQEYSDVEWSEHYKF